MSNSKTTVAIGFAAIIALASCGAPPSEPRQTYRASTEKRSAVAEEAARKEKSAREEQAAREDFADWLIRRTQDGVKSRLRDPDSAKFSNVHIAEFKGEMVVCGFVNAANGFGGKTGFQKFVGLSDTVFLEEDDAAAVNEAWVSMGCR